VAGILISAVLAFFAAPLSLSSSLRTLRFKSLILAGPSFDSDHHRVGTQQVLHAGFAEAGFLHPTHAIGAGVIETASGLDQHVQAHEQTEGVLGPVVVDDAVINDERASVWNRFSSTSGMAGCAGSFPVDSAC
jgi:hypothetical protein